MSIKFVGKPHLIFMVKINGLEAIFSENVFLLKDRKIEMFALKPEKPQVRKPLIYKALEGIFQKIF